MEKDNAFEQFIQIINNEPNNEEIFTIIYTLYYALPYLHKQYLIENIQNFEKATINYYNNLIDLNDKDNNNISKDQIDLLIKFFKKISEKEKNIIGVGKKIKSFNDEIIINLAIRMLKSNNYEKRIKGITALNDYIDENKNNEQFMKILSGIINKNELIRDIFGPNYHSKIISESKTLLLLLLKNNEIKEKDIEIIFDCSQRGDWEAYDVVMNLLSGLVDYLNENHIITLIGCIINNLIKKKIKEKEWILNHNLLKLEINNNKNNDESYLENLYQNILKIDLINNNLQKNQIIIFNRKR